MDTCLFSEKVDVFCLVMLHKNLLIIVIIILIILKQDKNSCLEYIFPLFIYRAKSHRYCRENYIDLVTLEDWTDMEELLALENVMSTESAWIGLRKAEHKQTWGLKEPTNLGDEYCSVMDFNGKFQDTKCEMDRSFICYERMF
uniref:C-type lectin domain-containing protein n=1 Tax=Sinocyclocheilus rhinocerous TaxID=307959 RepID=A0A673KTG1_9TELE